MKKYKKGLTMKSTPINNLFDKLKWPSSVLLASICFTTVWSMSDLFRFYFFGTPLRESTLLIIATMGIISIINWLIIENRIKKIKNAIS